MTGPQNHVSVLIQWDIAVTRTMVSLRGVILCLTLAVLLRSDLAMGQDGTSPPLPAVKHMIDTHIHLFDSSRPEGIPWPPADDKVLYKPHLPAEFSSVAKPSGVTGVVIVEASDRLEDNRWVLDLVKDDPFYVALVGNIDPYRKDFGKQLRVLKKDKRFVGIRARNSDPIDYNDPQVLKNFRRLAKAGLSLDILANGKGVEGVREVDELAGKVPELRIVVDHVLGYDIDGNPPGKEWLDAVASLARHENVFCKVSGLYQRCTQQPAPHDPEHYRTVLDSLFKDFGPDRLIYGSNWPCTKKSGDYDSFVRLVNAYFAEKGQEACEKYFWKNAAVAYGLPLK
ncbi:MAG: amidohydrolase family protein [Rubripirellula sp.]